MKIRITRAPTITKAATASGWLALASLITAVVLFILKRRNATTQS
jgi:hypothetical protein